ncbi:MAG: hypothetical protein ACU0DW_01315 [Shimia sp.]
MWSLETLGRERLSANFWMREFLYSEIGNFHQVQNIPDRPDVALARGRRLCETLLEPLNATFGRIFVRSGYRSAALNTFGNENKLNCARTDNPLECHVWDLHDAAHAVAGASVVIPWFADHYAKGRDWRDLAWWMHDHLPPCDIWFFPKLAAFNIAWRATPRPRIDSYIAPKGTLWREGWEAPPDRAARYDDFPPYKEA